MTNLIKFSAFAAVLATSLCAKGQTFTTNTMATAEATRVAARLPLGASKQEVDRLLQKNHLAVTYSLAVTRSPALTRACSLADGCCLILETTSSGNLKSASIQSNGVNIASITLTNRP
jgi:hypothetical protein